jgi:hypothetical protein
MTMADGGKSAGAGCKPDTRVSIGGTWRPLSSVPA